MSNVGPQRSESWRASKAGSSMHAGLSVLRRPAGSRWPSSATAIYLIEILGSRRTFTGCPSFGGQHAVGLNGWEEIWNTSNNRTRRVRSHQRSGSGHEPGDLPKAWFAQFCRGDHVPHASKLAPGRAVAQPFVRGDVTKAASRPLRRASTQTLGTTSDPSRRPIRCKAVPSRV